MYTASIEFTNDSFHQKTSLKILIKILLGPDVCVVAQIKKNNETPIAWLVMVLLRTAEL